MHYFPFRYTNNLTLYTKDVRAGQSDWELEDKPNKKTDLIGSEYFRKGWSKKRLLLSMFLPWTLPLSSPPQPNITDRICENPFYNGSKLLSYASSYRDLRRTEVQHLMRLKVVLLLHMDEPATRNIRQWYRLHLFSFIIYVTWMFNDNKQIMFTSLISLGNSSLKSIPTKHKLNSTWLTWIPQSSILRLPYLAQHLANTV